MSYQDIAGGATRELRSYPGQEPAGDKANRELIAKIFRLQTDVTRLRADVDRLGGPRDTLELRQKVGGAITTLQRSATDIKGQLLAVHRDAKSVQTTKIVSDFEATLRDLQAAMRVAKAKEAASLPRPDAPQARARAAAAAAAAVDPEAARDEVERTALLQEQKQVEVRALENEMGYNEALIAERDAGIADITAQIGEVNEIFQDLAVLVNDQGQMLDDIEANITRTAERTREAGGELRQAERSQRSARNKSCFVLSLVGGVLGLLVVVFWATT